MKTNNIQLAKYPAYKDSGVEWLGEIPEHWDAVSLGSILELKSDKNHPDYEVLSVYREYGVIKKDSRDDNHNATSLDTSNYKAVEPGDLVVNKMKAWQGSMGVSPYKGIVSPAYITCRVNSEKIHPDYLHQLLRCDLYIGEYNRLSYGVRVGQWDMHYEDFKHITTTIPPIAEQTSIANFLDNKTALIDKAIALKEKQIELLKERRQILIHHAVTRGLNPNVKLKDSGVEWIGEIPESWEVKKLKYTVITNPSHNKNKSLFGKEVSFMPMECLRCGKIEERTILYENALSYVPFMNNDIVMAKVTPCFENNNIAIASNLINDVGFGTSEIFVFRCNEIVDKQFLFYFLQTEYIKMIGIKSMTGTAGLKRVNINILLNSMVILPTKNEQLSIVDFIDASTRKISTAISLKEKEIEKLKEYKSVLINAAVSGKIKIG